MNNSNSEDPQSASPDAVNHKTVLSEQNSKITATARNLAFGGDFVCDVTKTSEQSWTGIKAFVPFVLPGESFEAIVEAHEGRLLRAALTKVLESSPKRVEPACPYFGECGGCSLQHSQYDFQVEIKRKMISSALQYNAKLKISEDHEDQIITRPTKPYQYRSRIKLQIALDGTFGFFKKNSNQIVSITACSISSELINKAIQALRTVNPRLMGRFSNILIEELEGQVYLQFIWQGISKPERTGLTPLTELFLGFTELNRISIQFAGKEIYIFEGDTQDKTTYLLGHFSQANPIGNSELQKIVLAEAEGFHSALELYAGAGNFSIPLAEAGLDTTAVEVDPELVHYGQLKGKAFASKIKWHTTTCEKYLRNKTLAELVIADPPRSGLKTIMKAFQGPEVKKLIYISCSLPHLTRDLKQLSEQNYRLVRTYFVDLFPQTHYVETIAILERI